MFVKRRKGEIVFDCPSLALSLISVLIVAWIIYLLSRWSGFFFLMIIGFCVLLFFGGFLTFYANFQCLSLLIQIV